MYATDFFFGNLQNKLYPTPVIPIRRLAEPEESKLAEQGPLMKNHHPPDRNDKHCESFPKQKPVAQ